MAETKEEIAALRHQYMEVAKSAKEEEKTIALAIMVGWFIGNCSPSMLVRFDRFIRNEES